MIRQAAMRLHRLKTGLVLGGLVLAALSLPTGAANARVFVSVGVPIYGPGPWYYGPPPVVYAPPPAYYYPPPAYYPPQPVVVAPQPAPPPTISPQAQTWYYCDNPQGYYPYVSACNSGWRQVPAQQH
jgi:hypothetical protein